VGEEPDAPWVLSSHPRHAHIAGFDLHANVAVPAADRARLEQLCRYLLRPPVAQDRLRRMGDDYVLLSLKTAWADGTRHLLFSPMELLEKLARWRCAASPAMRMRAVVRTPVIAWADPDVRERDDHDGGWRHHDCRRRIRLSVARANGNGDAATHERCHEGQPYDDRDKVFHVLHPSIA
jgi:hypothetical protein